MFGVGTGFHNELTGHQNAMLYGRIWVYQQRKF